MSLLNRVKCTVSITSGVVASIAPITGFVELDAGTTNAAYLLEDNTGAWEVGVMSTVSARVLSESSGGGFGANHAGLTLSLIAPRAAYVDTGPLGAVGANSIPLATGTDSIAVGRESTASASGALAVGTDADAAGARAMALGNWARAEEVASAALGYRARAKHPGEMAIGHYMLPHTSIIPVTAEYSAGFPTVWTIRPLVDVDDYAYTTSAAELTTGVQSPLTAQSNEYFAVRVRGTIITNTVDDVDMRGFDVDFATYKGALLYNSSTTKFTVGTAGVAFGVSAAGVMEINPGTAGAALRVRGVLRVDKIPFIM